MNSTDVVAQFRSDVNDIALPYLWPDDEVFGYLEDAQKMFCRLAWGIGDATTPAVTQLPVIIGFNATPMSDRILKLRAAYQTSDGAPIEVINFEDMGRLGIRFDGRTGPVQYLIIGLQPNLGFFYPVPTIANTVQLLVDRLPITAITNVGSQVLEIAEPHHRHLTLWMRALAYLKQDAQTADKTKAADFDAKFHAYCDQAKEEKARAMHKTRIVRYSGVTGASNDNLFPSY